MDTETKSHRFTKLFRFICSALNKQQPVKPILSSATRRLVSEKKKSERRIKHFENMLNHITVSPSSSILTGIDTITSWPGSTVQLTHNLKKGEVSEEQDVRSELHQLCSLILIYHFTLHYPISIISIIGQPHWLSPLHIDVRTMNMQWRQWMDP